MFTLWRLCQFFSIYLYHICRPKRFYCTSNFNHCSQVECALMEMHLVNLQTANYPSPVSALWLIHLSCSAWGFPWRFPALSKSRKTQQLCKAICKQLRMWCDDPVIVLCQINKSTNRRLVHPHLPHFKCCVHGLE